MLKKVLIRAKKQERAMRAVTGMSIRQFKELTVFFEQALFHKASNRARKRMYGGGRKGILKDVEEKVFFILFYLKVYPTYDVAALFFEADRSQPCRWVKTLFPILERALGQTLDLPKRKISSVQEFEELFQDINDILIDVTERKAQRPRSSKNLKRRYSGKKKSHTRKNTIMADTEKKIRFISPTKNGKSHDFKLFKEDLLDAFLPEKHSVWLDKGYTGICSLVSDPSKIHIPKKKPQRGSLTEEEVLTNKAISSLRMPVEHAIGGMKRYGCMTTPIRNKNWKTEDKMPLLCAGLWNFHLKRR